MALKRIIVTNAKGGCGKTTITTNIASHYALQGKNVRLFDHDAQGSSLAWLNRLLLFQFAKPPLSRLRIRTVWSIEVPRPR